MNNAVRLLVAIFALLALAGAGAAGFFYFAGEKQLARIAQLERELKARDSEATALRDANAKLLTKAAELDTQLGHAKTRSTASETKTVQLARELTATKSTLTERQQREVALMSEIEALRQKIKAAESAPVAVVPVPPVGAPASMPTTLAPAVVSPPAVSEEDLAAYERRIIALERQLTELLARALAESPEPTPAPAPAEPVGHRVVRVGAQEAFVVLDYGAEQGAAVGDEATVARGTSVIARVQISDVRPRFSIAQVLPSARKGQLQAGDIVLLAK